MFTISYTTGDKKRHTLSGPTSWEEFTVEHWQRVHAGWTDRSNLTQLLSLVYNVEYKVLFYAPDRLLNPVINAAKFILMDSVELQLIPRKSSIEIDGTLYEVPKKLGSQQFGKAIQAKALLTKPFEENVSMWAALYLTPSDERFTMDKVQELKMQVDKMPIQDIYPISFFSYSAQLSSGSALTNVWHQLKPTKKKIERRLVNWQAATFSRLTVT